MKRFQVRKVAVLGAGVMGAQIAAHLVNVRVPVVLFDLAAKDGPKNAVVTRAIDNLKKLNGLSSNLIHPGLSLLVAALFAWHPLHVESVAWISCLVFCCRYCR